MNENQEEQKSTIWTFIQTNWGILSIFLLFMIVNKFSILTFPFWLSLIVLGCCVYQHELKIVQYTQQLLDEQYKVIIETFKAVNDRLKAEIEQLKKGKTE